MLRSKLTASPEAANSDKMAISLHDGLAKTSTELKAVKAQLPAGKVDALNANILKQYNLIVQIQEETARQLTLRPVLSGAQLANWQNKYAQLIVALQNAVTELKKSSGALQTVAAETRKNMTAQPKEAPLEQFEKANEMLSKLINMNTKMASDIAGKMN
jgi:hypothetical protein